jgi:protein-tyrosine-phosphatase
VKQYNILFLCTHNSARSILGEALASTHPSGKFMGFSAGSTPGTSINPIAEELALEMGMDPVKLKSKSWDVFGESNAPQMDFIITVCDNAAGEVCPFWPGKPVIEKKAAFVNVMNGLRKRIDILADMPLDKLDSISLRQIHSQS